ncbi:hypothetical protein LTR56_025041 [Elasticomyces elasticus]|nr:hypothetical protein LTR56_025041 [Elasticomyces elasticus]KAK3621178.1 hypothetical protein LTR22_025308 [Elasticomyces elasticus]KAK5755700.1 hypothetical protein LTS12_014162 [Elasticomyces elasticus]
MRFLERVASHETTTTHEFSLTEFDAAHLPSEYAILSHRWGTCEVTYGDVENGTANTKAGYQKLKFCAERGAHDGITYFWVDTCCIDKASSAEVTEAINSMYSWYQNATKCYVYMLDVSAMDCNSTLLAEGEWQSAFRNSTWFTRGWTLQELIAPKVVEFFLAEKVWLGDKRSLEQQIHLSTGMPVEALRGNISHFDIQERLSWAAKRQTTLEEDAVYCLLGIVNVHMPLIYGEGRQKAMARLQRELQMMSVPDVQSSFAQSTGEAHITGLGASPYRSPTREVMDWEGFLRSLSYPEMDYRYHNIDNTQDNTCSWLLNHHCYQEWNSQAASKHILVIRGKPGSGKSTAMKRAYTLAQNCAREKEAIVGFFFNFRGVAMETKLEGFLRSMLYQLLQRRYCTDNEGFTEWKRKHSTLKSGWIWTTKELHTMFARCVRGANVKITMFVDALDECESTSDVRNLMDLLTDLVQEHNNCESPPKICVSSRHYPNVGVAGPLQIIVEGTNRPDITVFARNILRPLLANFEVLSQKVTSCSEGIFLWAVLVLQKLREAVGDGEPPRTLHEIVDHVPRRLEELFQGLIDSTPTDERGQRNLIFLWILFAKRSLTLSELNHALAFRYQYPTYSHYERSVDFIQHEQFNRLLAKRTRGLVEVVEIDEEPWNGQKLATLRVQFIHESVRQYLNSQQHVIGLHSDMTRSVPGSAHSALALSCFNYIKAVCTEADIVGDLPAQPDYLSRSFEHQRLRDGHAQTRPLLEYATKFGFDHANLAEASGSPQSYLFESRADHTSRDGRWWEPFTRLFKVYRERRGYNYDDVVRFGIKHWSEYITTQLAFACAFKLNSWVSDLLCLGLDKTQLSQALCVTATSGDTSGLASLIQAGADVDYEVPTFGSPLYLTIVYGRTDFVKILMRHGAGVRTGPQSRSTLVCAALCGSAKVVRLLLTRDPNIAETVPQENSYWPMSISSLGMHALEAAVHNDFMVIQALLDAAERQQVPADYYKTAFLSAQALGKAKHVQSLRSVITRLVTIDRPITVFVKPLAGPCRYFEVWADTSFAVLKLMIQLPQGPRPDQIMLVHNCRILRDHRTMDDDNVIHESTIHILLRARWRGITTNGG